MVTDGGALGINATSGNGNMNSVGWCQCQCTICKWWVTDRNKKEVRMVIWYHVCFASGGLKN